MTRRKQDDRICGVCGKPNWTVYDVPTDLYLKVRAKKWCSMCRDKYQDGEAD